MAKALSNIFLVYYKLRYGNRVVFGKNILINHKFKLKGQGRVFISNDCRMWAHQESNQFYLYNSEAEIRVGEGTLLNGLTVHCKEKVLIGKNCIVGSAIIMDNDFHEITDPTNVLYGSLKTKPVIIGNDVWLGGQCALLKGSEIGDKSVVGFRAVVTKSFPNDVVIAGNPAKIVKEKYVENQK